MLKGISSTIFAYGSTGAGKTFTMLGDKGNHGIIPRILIDLFKNIIKNE